MLNSVIPGAVVILPIDTLELDDRSGMSSSTRKQIAVFLEINYCPKCPVKNWLVLYSPSKTLLDQHIRCSCALGLVVQGVNKFDFQDSYWPHHVESINDEETLRWLDSCISLVQTRPRPPLRNEGNEDLSIENTTPSRCSRSNSSRFIIEIPRIG